MKVGVLGTGIVGRALAGKLAELNYEVIIGTRHVESLLARSEPDNFGNPPFRTWLGDNPKVKVGTFVEAASQGELLVNALQGAATLEVLSLIGASVLNSKVLIDISNPLDFSQGMPPTLFVANNDSLAEQIQRTYPDLKVVKTLNSVNAHVMINPGIVNRGDHDMFISGNDTQSKERVTAILKEGFGWTSVIDLGDLSAARTQEMYVLLWVRLMGAMRTPMFNLKLVL